MAIRTGAQYVKALRDGREVWHAGRRIDDVTTHPGFTGTIKTLADLYDKQHAPETKDIMTVEYEGERIACGYLPPRNPEELALKRRNIELWSQQTFGQMGRYPDFCAQLVVGLFDWAHIIEKTNPRWAENARAYHRHASRKDLCLTHALTDQYYDRTKRVSEQEDPDLILHIVGETQKGAVVRGLRTLATLAPLSDEVLVYPNRPREADETDYAIAFALPMNTPGLKIVCRDLYAEHADPERHPLTARFDEVDAALIFDDVVVPWERIFVYKDPKLLAGINVHPHLGAVLDHVASDYQIGRLLGHRPTADPAGETQHQLIGANAFIEFNAGHRDLAGLHGGRGSQGLPRRRGYLGAAVKPRLPYP